jgi:serine/threonine-protein kinase
MSDSSSSRQTEVYDPTDPPAKTDTSADFSVDSNPPPLAGASVLKLLGASLPDVPRIALRDPLTEAATPVNLPRSSEMLDVRTSPQNAVRLQLIGEIARGGMGAVLKGRDMDLGRDIAVKLLLEKHQGQGELIRRFVEEAQISGQLQHPGIVPVYELGAFADSRPYFTMKLVKGQTMADLLETRKSAAEDRPRLLSVFKQVCQTLAYAHARGVIHRDLKPSNIMVGAFGEVQVMDWGLAKVLHEGEGGEETRAYRLGDISRSPRLPDGGVPERDSRTQAGTLLGTPAYMAPEQARGEVTSVDERADVFGLGAILCEILTGQPPFAGKAAEAACKAQAAELEDAYARIDDCGADAELRALAKRCLAARSGDRPRHAGQVADEVTAYEQSVAERLRRAELARAAEEARAVEAQATAAQERRAKEAAQARALAEWRSRRLTVALAASVLLTVLLGGGVWLLRAEREARRTRTNYAVDEALNRALALHEQARTAEGQTAMALAAQAREQAQRAEALVQHESTDADLVTRLNGLRAELDADEKDRQLLAALESARLAQAGMNARERRFARERAVPLFREALRTYGMPAGEGEAGAAAARLEARPAAVREAVLAALDEWIALAEDPRLKVEEPYREWLQAVLAAAEPGGWEKDLREAVGEADPVRRRAALEKLAAVDVQRLPARAVTRLAKRLEALQGQAAAVDLLRRASRQYPGDFWVNHSLGLALLNQKPAEAERYLAIAVALRPDSAGPHNNLGLALQNEGKSEEAIAEYRRALDLDPNYAGAHTHLGIALMSQGKMQEAIREFRQAIDRDPKYAPAHNNLGNALAALGKREEAIAAYRRALAANPKDGKAHYNLGLSLLNQRKLDEAIAEFHQALDLDPNFAMAHNNLGIALFEQGKPEDALAEFRKAIALNPKDAATHNNLGFILLEKHRPDEAISEFRAAIAADPKFTSAWYNLGSALHSEGKLEEAIAAFHEAAKLDPKDIKIPSALAEAFSRLGRYAPARDYLRRCLDLCSKDDPRRASIVRDLRGCERLVELEQKLPQVLAGQVQPANVGERLEYANLCYRTNRPAAAARFYADAFATDPKLTGDPNAGHRYNAACCAGRAGCGQGEDAKKLDDKERARWRNQALDWLRADLTAYRKRVDGDKPEDRKQVRQQMEHWRQDGDLAGIRDPAAVAKLSKEEQQACRKLWAEVEELRKKAQTEK